ncbi:hypothetical protein [Urbifossiella limnaea]|uniref:Uncharacterized protein n=1 Tax=Urbifossiella limnaea TaxID=2528023 RepID=A0A517Y111_9BACT|nr:hypothetical protein [Urbifossiella limnaea]QDU23434.1 hypothetical protein ETAA1_54340 [Urbifossiella limnaea]
MPRRESYQTDDDYDDRRGSASGGGGIPGWVWVVGGGGALAVVVVVGLMFFAFTARREAMVQHEVARAELARDEAQMMRAEGNAVGGHGAVGMAPDRLPVLSLLRVTNAYKNDPGTAEVRYTNQRVRVRVEVKATGEGWVGTSADLGSGPPRPMASNVIFRLDDDGVAAGTTVVIEGMCAGLSPGPADGPMRGPTLTFTNCRVVRE